MSDEPTVAAAQKAEISFDDFARLDLQIATITHAEFHPNADRLLKIQLDDGTEAGRQVCAGIRAWYEPEQLVGKQVVIVANLQPRTIRGELSQGMILAVSSNRPAEAPDGEGQTDVIVLTPDRPAAPGSTVS